MLTTYAKAAVALVPGASRLPWVAGGGSDIPELELERTGVIARREALAAYARVCGFRVRDELPATYPHVLAFPLHMQLMTDGRFPFPAIGLVHVANRIAVHRPLRAGEPFDLRVRPSGLEPHPSGQAFGIVTEAVSDGEVVWEETSTMLRRGRTSGDARRRGAAGEDAGGAPPPFRAEWRLPGDLGRRYASVSGDRNPIHLHPLSARLLGFPRAIAHGMWTQARCLAALEPRLPDAYTVEVAFRKPILLPSAVAFASDGERFAVRAAAAGDAAPHLTGTVRPRSAPGRSPRRRPGARRPSRA